MRRGRWVVIATLDDGRVLRGQNAPRASLTRTLEDRKAAETKRLQRLRTRVQRDAMKREDRIIRSVLGVPVR